jgi:hypothetical protein
VKATWLQSPYAYIQQSDKYWISTYGTPRNGPWNNGNNLILNNNKKKKKKLTIFSQVLIVIKVSEEMFVGFKELLGNSFKRFI